MERLRISDNEPLARPNGYEYVYNVSTLRDGCVQVFSSHLFNHIFERVKREFATKFDYAKNPDELLDEMMMHREEHRVWQKTECEEIKNWYYENVPHTHHQNIIDKLFGLLYYGLKKERISWNALEHEMAYQEIFRSIVECFLTKHVQFFNFSALMWCFHYSYKSFSEANSGVEHILVDMYDDDINNLDCCPSKSIISNSHVKICSLCSKFPEIESLVINKSVYHNYPIPMNCVSLLASLDKLKLLKILDLTPHPLSYVDDVGVTLLTSLPLLEDLIGVSMLFVANKLLDTNKENVFVLKYFCNSSASCHFYVQLPSNSKFKSINKMFPMINRVSNKTCDYLITSTILQIFPNVMKVSTSSRSESFFYLNRITSLSLRVEMTSFEGILRRVDKNCVSLESLEIG